MSVYKRVNCPKCRKNKELRSGDDKLKKITCRRCGHPFDIKKENTIYWIDFYAKNKRYRESLGVVSKAFAETVLFKRKVEVAEGKFLDVKKEKKIKFIFFADEYIELYAKTNNIAWERSIVPNMKALKRFFGGKDLVDITPQLIEGFKVERVKEVSPAATNRALTLLKSMFNRAIEWNKFDGINPATRVKFFREENHKLRYLEKEQITKLIANCDDFIRPLVIVAINTGLRKAELFNLRWQDIDINQGVIHLMRTKNGEQREVPMNQSVKIVIMNIQKHPESEYVFCSRQGKPYVDIRVAFSNSLKRAGIENFRWHDLRHSFASQLAMAGVDLNTIRELMGHKSTRMTIRYAHLSSNHKSNAVDVLNKRLDTTIDTTSKVDYDNKSLSLQPIEKSTGCKHKMEALV